MRSVLSARCAVALLFGALLATACLPAAGARGAEPLGVARFAMQPLEGQYLEEVSYQDIRLVDVPTSFTQAGGHPWGLATTIEFAHETFEGPTGEEEVVPTRDPKDVVVDLPPGLLGNPQAVPRCPLALLLASTSERCPADTQVGMARLRWYGGHKESFAPLVNTTPEAGQSAEFGLETDANVSVLLTAHVVRVGSTYGLTVVSNEIPLTGLLEVETVFWGVPADPSHDAMRSLQCSASDTKKNPVESFEECLRFHGGGGPVSAGIAPAPFLSMPADCTSGPLVTAMHTDSWQEPGSYATASAAMPAMTGCNLLRFAPELEVSPLTRLADAPVELGVNLKVPQQESPSAPVTPQLRNTVLTFPEGLSISPGIVDGIQACNESGPEGINFEGPESEEKGLNGEPQLAPGHCPDASIVGTARAYTPLLGEPVEGHVYLARPNCGGAGQRACTPEDAADGELYQLYLELGGHGALADTGVNLKVRLKVKANPATGQLTTVAENTPQLPFSKLEVHLNGGPRAPLDNPAACGQALSTSDLTPWSEPGATPAPESFTAPGTPDAAPSSYYTVEGCASPPGLSPGFLAGTVTPQAGQYSAFTLNVTRQDREQFIKGIQVHTPPGLLGVLSSVPLCDEAQAQAGTCPEASKIGTTRVASGAGSHPFEIEGNVYLTEKYDGAPFGLSIVTHVVAGPFNLGVVVVRARIGVDPQNSTLTITTDETGPHAIPQIFDGVPLRLKRVTVNIDRPNFMFNPTNCGAPGAPGSQQVTAKVSGSEDAVADVQSQFSVGGCQSLQFKPRFAASVQGQTSRAGGASLDVKLSYPAGSLGSEANIASVKVELPKQLPSRLTTLQKACAAAQFEENPGGCPAASVVGVVRASTPLLPVELTGPAYFVSHGGEAFPSLIVVLQGDGVRVDLTGSTFISAKGITSSTFKTVPDVPVNTFELYLPEGPYSALAANGDFCDLTKTVKSRRSVARKVHGKTVHKTVTVRTSEPAGLTMPTEFVAQNGAVARQDTQIEVTGCARAKPKAKARKARTKAGQADINTHARTGR